MAEEVELEVPDYRLEGDEEEIPDWLRKARECRDSGYLGGEAIDAFRRFAERSWATPKIVEWIEREYTRVLRIGEEREVLTAVLNSERLSDREQEAFTEWWDDPPRPLSDRQRNWLNIVARRLGLEELNCDD